MNKTELVIQLLKIAIGIAFAAYFLWWSLAVLQSACGGAVLTPPDPDLLPTEQHGTRHGASNAGWSGEVLADQRKAPDRANWAEIEG